MKCPRCGENTPDNWQFLECIDRKKGGETRGNAIRGERGKEPDGSIFYRFDWMICAAAECGQIVVRAQHTYRVDPDQTGQETFTVVPRGGKRPIDPIVQKKEPGMTRDYREAVSILDLSPRLSALLSRRILADLMEKYAGLSDWNLEERVKKFKSNSHHPAALRDAVNALRQMGNWAAHTKTSKDDQAETVEASYEEAEWSLEVLDRLFDYLIIGPEKDALMLRSINDKAKSISGRET